MWEIYFNAFSIGFIWEETAFPGLILIGLHFLALFWKDLLYFPVLFWENCVSCGGWYIFFLYKSRAFILLKIRKTLKKFWPQQETLWQVTKWWIFLLKQKLDQLQAFILKVGDMSTKKSKRSIESGKQSSFFFTFLDLDFRNFFLQWISLVFFTVNFIYLFLSGSCLFELLQTEMTMFLFEVKSRLWGLWGERRPLQFVQSYRTMWLSVKNDL